MNTEAQLIKRIARAIPSRTPTGKPPVGMRMRLGIGDDSAIITPGNRFDLLVSCDAFLEGVHFIADVHPPDSVGYKSLVRAASDLAAMGATPRLFLMTLALPSPRTRSWLDQFLQGMGRAARQLGMHLAGGDTSKNPAISISITVIGEARKGIALSRSGARPGDLIYVTGKLGQAQLGLDLMKSGLGRQRRFANLVRPHLYPRIRIELGKWLAERRVASAMMDLSDGLSTDLPRLAEASAVGARISADLIPRVTIPANLSKHSPGLNADPLSLALHGGEDYELLFTVPRSKVKLLQRAPDLAEITHIGEITHARRILLVDLRGKASPLASRGWDPFRKL